MEEVAVMVFDVVKEAAMLMPLPPVVALVPPIQLEKTTGQTPVNVAPRVTP